MPRVTFQDCGIAAISPDKGTVLECALRCGIDISHICGGDGACGTCRIEVIEGWNRLSPQTPVETSRDMSAPYRLACQADIRGDIVVRIAAID